MRTPLEEAIQATLKPNVIEELSASSVRRMQGLVNQKDISMMTKAASSIVKNLEEDGFEKNEILDYLRAIIDKSV